MSGSLSTHFMVTELPDEEPLRAPLKSTHEPYSKKLNLLGLTKKTDKMAASKNQFKTMMPLPLF